MKKFLILTLLTVAFIFTCCIPLLAGGMEYADYSWQNVKKVKAGIRECTITLVDAEAEIGLAIKAKYDEKGRITVFDKGWERIDFVYDKAGALTEEIHNWMDGDEPVQPPSKTVYSYDAKGRLVKISQIGPEGEVMLEEGGITYDKAGNLIIERLNPEGSIIRIETYNKEFFLTNITELNGEDVAMGNKPRIWSKTRIMYDKDWNITEKVVDFTDKPYDDLPKTIKAAYKYKFDKAGNKIEETTVVTPNDARYRMPEFMHDGYRFAYGNSIQPKKDDKTKDTATKMSESKTKAESLVGKEVEVEWNGEYYTATILEQDGEKFLIHYKDYDSSWDEWVTKDRIKF